MKQEDYDALDPYMRWWARTLRWKRGAFMLGFFAGMFMATIAFSICLALISVYVGWTP